MYDRDHSRDELAAYVDRWLGLSGLELRAPDLRCPSSTSRTAAVTGAERASGSNPLAGMRTCTPLLGTVAMPTMPTKPTASRSARQDVAFDLPRKRAMTGVQAGVVHGNSVPQESSYEE